MAGNVTGRNSAKLTKAALGLVGLSLAAPVLLAATLVLILSGRLAGNQPPGGPAQAAPQEYAQSFHMIIRETNQNIHMWARNLDGVPDFRQVVEAGGNVVSQQLYVGAEKTLYSSQQNPSQEPAWNKTGNLEPKDIGISNITAGPAVWALQYGVGDQQVRLQQGSLNVTVKSINQPIDDAVFKPTGTIDLNRP